MARSKNERTRCNVAIVLGQENAPPNQYDLMAFHEYMHFLNVEMQRRTDDAEIVVACSV